MAPRRAILGACIVVVVAGCGGSDSGTAAQDELRDAARAAREQTLRVEVTRSGNVPGEGMYGFEGSGLVRGADASVKGAIDGPEGPAEFEVRFRDDQAWLQVEGMREWVHAKPGRRTVETSFAPHYLLEVFEQAREVERVPGGQVDGAPAVHYRGVVPVPELEDELHEVASAGRPDERIPVDLYVADGLPKRLRMQYDAGQGNTFIDVVVLGVSSRAPAGRPAGPVKDYDEI